MLNIYQLIDFTTGAIIPYEPSLRDQVAEIVNIQNLAIESTRLTLLRERLAGLEPVTTPRRESGDSLVIGLFARREDN